MGRRVYLLIGLLVLAAGCGVNSTFVYKPGVYAAGGGKIPVKVAVLPFKDGTENFTQRGGIFSGGQYNFAKAGLTGTVTALTPELWAKSFSEELAASGGFQSVRFLFNPSEISDEDYYVEGVVKKAYFGIQFENPNEFEMEARATRRTDKQPVWENTVSKVWKTPPKTYAGCGLGIQCSVDKYHAEINNGMRELFTEAGADLRRTLAAGPSGGGGRGEEHKADLPPGGARNEPFVGVGLEVNIVNSVLAVARTVEGAPAAKAGMHAGDAILAIDGQPTTGMSVVDAVGRIRGVKGTPVTLGVIRAGWPAPRDFTMVRDVIGSGTSTPPAPESVEQTIESILKGK